MRIEEFLEGSAERFPDKVALVCGEHRLTYSQLDRQCNRVANALLASGLQRWDRVAICLENCAEAVIAIFAVLKAGGVFLLMNPGAKAARLEYLLSNSRASALITSGHKVAGMRGQVALAPYVRIVIVKDVAEPLDRLGVTVLPLGEILKTASDARSTRRGIDLDLAALIYSSGTTGQPKGVMMTHLALVSACASIATYLENTAADVIIDVLPLAFSYGLAQLLVTFKTGATLVLERGFTYPAAVIQTLIRERVTGFAMVPTISSVLAKMDPSQLRLPDLRYITNAASAMPLEHIRQLRARLPHVKIYAMHGLSECVRTTYLPPEQIDIRPLSVGRGMAGVELYIVDESGSRVGPGVIGELVVRGSNLMNGYWEMPEETAKVLRDGNLPWPAKVLYTGDLFTSDDEGYLYWVSRKDDIIKTRGEKVSPQEVEDLICKLPQVAEAAVLGIPDEALGNAIKALIALKPDAALTKQQVLLHCREVLEDYMLPKYVEFVAAIPRTENGKISRRELAAGGGGSV